MTVRLRLRRLLLLVGGLLAAGLAYSLWLRAGGFAIPCPLRALTGLKCPGCGVTALCLALLRLDASAAWAANPALLLCLPILLLLLLRLACRYVQAGSFRLSKWENALCWALVVLLLLWGVVRNL